MKANRVSLPDLRLPVLGSPIRWLVLSGGLLIAAIAIGTAVMVGNFRERSLNSSERELANTVLLLARHFDQQIEDFTVIQNDVVAQIRLAGISSTDVFRERMATLEWHEMLRSQSRRILRRRRHQCVRFGGSADQFVRKLAGSEGQRLRSSLLQCPQIGNGGHAGSGRTGAEPFRPGLGHRDRP